MPIALVHNTVAVEDLLLWRFKIFLTLRAVPPVTLERLIDRPSIDLTVEMAAIKIDHMPHALSGKKVSSKRSDDVGICKPLGERLISASKDQKWNRILLLWASSSKSTKVFLRL